MFQARQVKGAGLAGLLTVLALWQVLTPSTTPEVVSQVAPDDVELLQAAAAAPTVASFPNLSSDERAQRDARQCSRERPEPLGSASAASAAAGTLAAAAAAAAAAHSCAATAPRAERGCGSCKARLRGSWEATHPFGVAEFSHRARDDGALNFVPIFAHLDQEVRKLPGRRVLLDIGFTSVSDVNWVADVYGSEPVADGQRASLHLFEPNPENFRKVQAAVAQSQTLQQRLRVSLFNKGLGDRNGEHLFWLNKDGSRSSFQRVRGDDYEQIPIRRNVSTLDSLFPRNVIVPFMKISAGRWESAVIRGGPELLERTAVVLADISPVPNNSRVVEMLSQQGFTVYALGCGSLGRIHQDRPWWWSPVLAVKQFLTPIAEDFVCFDFTHSRLVCDSPVAAFNPPTGCRDADDPKPSNVLAPDHEPVFSTAMASPETHRMLKLIFLGVIALTTGVLAQAVVVPLLLHAVAAIRRGR